MDEQSQKRLAEIVAAGPDSITEADAEFLRSRSSYLSEEERAVFADILRGVGAKARAEEGVEESPALPNSDEKSKKARK